MSSNTVGNSAEQLFVEGKAAAKRGDKVMARSLLTQVVEQDPRHEQAWMWLSGVVGDPEEQQICLENVLVINPDNAQARRGLEFTSSKTGILPRVQTAQLPGQNAPSDEVPLPPPDAGMYGAGGGQWSLAGGFGQEPGGIPFPGGENVSGGPGAMAPWMQSAAGSGEHSNSAAGTAGLQPAEGAMQGGWGDMNRPADQNNAGIGSALLNGNVNATQGERQYEGGSPGGPGPVGPTAQLPYQAAGTTQLPDQEGRPTEGGSSGDSTFEPRPFSPPASFKSPMGDNGDVSFEGAGGELEVPSWVQPAADARVPEPPMTQNAPQQAVSTQNLFDPNALRGGGHGGADQFGAPPTMDLGPVGPYSDQQLPSPDQLPGGQHSMHDAQPLQDNSSSGSNQGQSQPWYLQSSGGGISSPQQSSGGVPSYLDHSYGQEQTDGGGYSDLRPVAIISCPNCRQEVPETSLACPDCRFNFFANCPHCHELMDTADAKAGLPEPCPYCGGVVDKMQLGLTGTGVTVQKSDGKRANEISFPLMNQMTSGGIATVGRTALAWFTDLLWLVVVVLMVWALTQLPAWLHLTGQY